jgi:hydroxyethylthiazole kinase-like uncharacterized protein yjeF
MPLPILSVTEMRAWESASWAAGASEDEVIQSVGRAIARRLLGMTHPGDRVVMAAGKGHNGDDVRAAALHLPSREVDVVSVVDPVKAVRDLNRALERPAAVLVDGIFGIGLNRGLNADWMALLEAINSSGIPVVAVDVPSGIHGDTGEPMGAAVRADITLTVGAPKTGLLKKAAADFVGQLEVLNKTGLIPCPVRSDLNWILGTDFTAFPPRRAASSHKGTYGHLVLVAGSVGYHGAAVLATRAAQRAMPGLVTLDTEDAVYAPVASQLQAAMVRPRGFDDPSNFTAIAVGPGLANPALPARWRQDVVAMWQAATCPVLVDASALAWLPHGNAGDGQMRVITPHPGEAARMLKTTVAEVESDRPKAVRKLSERFGNCWVVLKGHHTLVGCHEGEIHVNGSGNPGLAQGGSGDVLAGYMAGLLAQPQLRSKTGETLRYAVWQHGATADRLAARHRSWTIEQLAAEIGDASPVES